MFLNANEEGYSQPDTFPAAQSLPPTNTTQPAQTYQPSTRYKSLLRLAYLAGYQVNEGYHAENLPNKKAPTCAFLLFGKERINILISGTKREQSRYI